MAAETFLVYPHADAWRLSARPEPPCVSMLVDEKEYELFRGPAEQAGN